ncbi:FeoA family protein [Halothermothrix orenii]|uniref:Ferrous iron transport protein FeoA n=1 Tax=Halothermothrix orenii (strain H 168 / OCM 544 / DSM 9562) TaxID=373903 RepID=B8D2C3_HALOH|nr:FeoA family protein [Halothermothrix orenii]ACL69350.1 Ferrous iron transport protein FeoA [Halothermothrix orenii H 168]
MIISVRKKPGFISKNKEFPLSRVEAGTKGIISQLKFNEPHIVKKLLGIGLIPGETIEVIRDFPVFIIKIGESKFALDEKLVSGIYIILGN